MFGRKRLAAFAASALLLGIGTLGAEAGASVSTQGVSPPKKKPIQPGAPVCTAGGPLDDGACSEYSTLNFVFRGNHRLYIGAVAHNFAGAGDRAMIRGETRHFGRVVVDDDSVDFLHPGDAPDPNGSDFALIRIRRGRHGDVQPSVRTFGGPTGYTTAVETETADAINAYGQGRPDLSNPTGPRSGQLVADSHRAFSSTVSESGGDSGMPYVHAETGKALGVNANCMCGFEPGLYPTVEYILERLDALGFRLKLVRGG